MITSFYIIFGALGWLKYSTMDWRSGRGTD